MRKAILGSLGVLTAIASGCAKSGEIGGGYDAVTAVEEEVRPYVFSWQDYRQGELNLRGGTTTGAPIMLDTAVSSPWQALQATPGSEPYAKDLAAIRALTGDYRTQFDFLEVMVFGEADGPATPYRSWGTEQVFVIGEGENYLDLQHVMVMYIVDDEGETQGPFVQKHWRQEWRYEPEAMLVYQGFGQWTMQPLSEEERAGRWVQTVYQVDDTPRYALIGDWTHNSTFSQWQSDFGFRPLPRRERTARKDYQIMAGPNRLTVTPTGWVHEQDNVKVAVAEAGAYGPDSPILAREYGVNRYDRLKDFDFSAGEAYWDATKSFWGEVRSAWQEQLRATPTLQIASACGETPVFMTLFGAAAAIEEGSGPSGEEQKTLISDLMGCIVTGVE